MQVTGAVYDLDYIQALNWCQVLTQDDTFIGVVRDARLQQPLQTAMQRVVDATIHYHDDSPSRVYRVMVELPPPDDPVDDGHYYVIKLDVNEGDGECAASFLGSGPAPLQGFTRDVRLESLLAVAMREGWPVSYLDIDAATREIRRAKINRG